ncbi:MAG: phage replisome organizer N-terminal domain-containing protein [Desulfobacteraceae bacterium]
MGKAWGRLYAGTRNHRKVKILRQRCPEAWWVIYPLLELAFESDDGGLIYIDHDLPFSLEELAADVYCEPELLEKALKIMETLKLVSYENGFIRFLSYEDRQFQSDDSKERVKRYREKIKQEKKKDSDGNGDVTLQNSDGNGDVTPPEQNRTEQSTEHNNTRRCAEKTSAPSLASNSDWFDKKFWPTYPSRNGRKPGRAEARKAYLDVRKQKDWPGEDAVLAALIAQIEHKNWCDEQGKFCPEFPDAARWFKKKRWTDEINLLPAPVPYNPKKMRMPDDVVFPDPNCPICGGSGAVDQPDGSCKPCTCLKKTEELKPNDRKATLSLPTFRPGS